MEIIDLTGDDGEVVAQKESQEPRLSRKRALGSQERDEEFKRLRADVSHDFIDEYDPSRTAQAVCYWISVRSSNYSPNYDGENVEGLMNLLSLKRAWVEMADKDRSRESLDALAGRFKVLSGKWMIFCNTSEARRTWTTIANAVVSGELGSS
eukprot:gene38438-46716_t